jgi:2-succinyl-5-enolpyruvyl-6-hydroxy-3-cyclohexene-1-carboxylate synthase
MGELYAWGVRDIVVSPGARSQALALAALEWERFTNQDLQVHVVIDERSAGFRALGIALESGVPAVCLSTSGSAPGHYLPAVMEAYHAGLPLIVVSADRPGELLGVGANQTTTQEGLFGVFARTVSVPTPERVSADDVAACVLDVMEEAIEDRRPVHVNIGFREPLSGEDATLLRLLEPRSSSRVYQAPDIVTLDPLPGTLVIAGSGAGAQAEELAVALGAPLVAEALSGAHFGPHLMLCYRELLHAGSDWSRVITFGRPTLSREVWALLSDTQVEHVVVRSDAAEVPNPSSQATVVDGIQVSRPATPEEISEWVKPWVMQGRALHQQVLDGIVPPPPELSTLESSDPATRSAFATKEMQVLRRPVTREALALALWEATWPHDRLILGASRMARVVDRVVGPKNIRVYSNRGLSGIDGTVSVARGVAGAALRSGVSGVTRVLLGDVALLHDAGSLMLEPGAPEGGRVHLFVANDGGGTIFDSLEVKQTAPSADVDRVMYTPHAVNLASLAAAYGWSYRAVATMAELTEALTTTETHLLVDIALPRD